MTPDRCGLPIAWLASLLCTLIAAPCVAQLASITITSESPQVRFAVGDLDAALRARKYDVRYYVSKSVRDVGPKKVHILFIDVSDPLHRSAAIGPMRDDIEKIRAEGFILRRGEDASRISLIVTSIDPAGAMYGALELAEQIRTRGVEGVANTDRNPYMPMRGTKFNIPLDLRTPSYSDMSDSAQQNIATVWDFEFWRAYLDQLARDRYNFVSLWNLHPFPSMVKVPAYPDVALDDVWRKADSRAQSMWGGEPTPPEE